MIVFDLRCQDSGDVFEGWFQSGADYEEQVARGLVQCPICRSSQVVKAPMAPQVQAKADRRRLPLEKLAEIQSAILENSEWVGDRFADEARAIHVGDSSARAVHGNATAAEAKALVDEGIPIAPLPFPVVPPNQVN